MKTWQKVTIGIGGVVVLGGIVLFSINQANKGVTTVQTAKVASQETPYPIDVLLLYRFIQAQSAARFYQLLRRHPPRLSQLHN